MILWNSESGCEEAQAYYYDWMDEQCRDEIPQRVQQHVGHCAHCQEEICSLEDALKSPSTSDPEAISHGSKVNAILETHFKYAEMPVTCDLAKRLLPSLTAPGVRITIPTPITVHIQQCSRCRNDWVELQSLNLSDVQLERLTERIKQSDVQRSLSRRRHLTAEQVQAFASVDYADLDRACLEHACECVPCRERILAARQTTVGHLMDDGSHVCEEVSWKDLFDLAMPVGFNPLVDECAWVRKAAVDHVGGCENCLGRLGELDRMLINFLSPHEGGVVTHYRFDLDETPMQTESGDHSIHVEVQHSLPSGLAGVGDQAESVSGDAPVHLSSRWMKVAAAVVVFLGVTLFSMMPHVEAGFMNQVYESTTGAPVVHVKVYAGGRTRLSKEMWIIPPNRALILQGQTWTDYNVSASAYREKDAVSAIPLDAFLTGRMQENIRNLYNLWPWKDGEAATLMSKEEAPFDEYRLEQSIGGTTFVWRTGVNRETQRVAWVERSDSYVDLLRFIEFSYPSLEEARQFFQAQGVDLAGL